MPERCATCGQVKTVFGCLTQGCLGREGMAVQVRPTVTRQQRRQTERHHRGTTRPPTAVTPAPGPLQTVESRPAEPGPVAQGVSDEDAGWNVPACNPEMNLRSGDIEFKYELGFLIAREMWRRYWQDPRLPESTADTQEALFDEMLITSLDGATEYAPSPFAICEFESEKLNHVFMNLSLMSTLLTMPDMVLADAKPDGPFNYTWVLRSKDGEPTRTAAPGTWKLCLACGTPTYQIEKDVRDVARRRKEQAFCDRVCSVNWLRLNTVWRRRRRRDLLIRRLVAVLTLALRRSEIPLTASPLP